MRRISLAASLAVALGVLAACGDDTSTPADAGPSAITAVAVGGAPATTIPGTPAPGPARDVPAALDFAAPLVGGGELDLRQYAGSTVALWFWAPT